MADTLPLQGEVNPRLPTEVCENVIEASYDRCYHLIQSSLATLSSCSLVCRAWRPRGQSLLFEYVLLRDKDALYRYAELVNSSPKVGAYMRTLSFRGYLHVPYSPAVLFPTVLRGKLPNLSEVYFNEFSADAKAAKQLPEGKKELPSLPIHPYFPSLLACISHIRILHLSNVRFSSFGDVARILDKLSNIQELHCEGLSWAVLGQEPQCMVKRDLYDSRTTFLPRLEFLMKCLDMDEQGGQRLLSTVGASLRKLWIKFPNDPPSRPVDHPVVEQEDPLVPAIHLECLPHLDRLYFWLAPFPQPQDLTLNSLRDTLASWLPLVPTGGRRGDVSSTERYLYLGPWYRQLFKRDEYLELLRAIGRVVEVALCRPSDDLHAGGSQTTQNTDNGAETDPCRITVVVHALADRLEWAEWWRAGIAECLPTFTKWNRLTVLPVHAHNPTDAWIDYEQLAPVQDLLKLDSADVLAVAGPSISEDITKDTRQSTYAPLGEDDGSTTRYSLLRVAPFNPHIPDFDGVQ
ncbi:hypothetical protein L226DRAFT_612233 [Lentinus tigrinus ALCF2SS1-7]|uniref:uncharacterized protein n=1 Tax=Lentinus tigrinus ALCF2SS1-7 TaxID=1328758 RepID=UPI00116625F9|nr:hypothetical protein L226DRAFT_612233 [Lentinus tigrinus ALCF2SS1-7]